jgi:hypothetical protein
LEKNLLSNLVGKEVEVYGIAENDSGQEKLVFRAKRIVLLASL